MIIGDPCAQNPCLNGGQCQPNGMGGFTCVCVQPFTGQRCEDRKFDFSIRFFDIILTKVSILVPVNHAETEARVDQSTATRINAFVHLVTQVMTVQHVSY